VHECFPGPGGAELQEGLEQGPLAVGVGRLAAGGQLDRQVAVGVVVGPDDVEVGQAELGRGQLGEDPDPMIPEAIEQGLDRGVGDLVQVDDDPPVHRPERQAVAVALEEFQKPVRQGLLARHPGPLAVGDRRDEQGPIAELAAADGHELDRHPGRPAGRLPDAGHPGQRPIRIIRRSGGEAQSERVADGFGPVATDHVAVGAIDPLGPADHGFVVRVLGQLAQGADEGFLGGRPVAVAVEMIAVGEGETGRGDRHAQAVEAPIGEGPGVPFGQIPTVGRGDSGEVGHGQACSIGKARVVGVPAIRRSNRARAWSRVTLGAYSNGVKARSNGKSW